MEATSHYSDRIITETYHKMRLHVFFYIKKIVGCFRDEDLEDITQDVFLRLLEYRQLLNDETIHSFVFTIARNLAIDYLRRYYKRDEVISYLYVNSISAVNDVEEQIIANNLADYEKQQLQLFAPQRRIIYALSRYEGMSADEIADEMNLSPRTVENHLRLGRRDMRTIFKQCI